MRASREARVRITEALLEGPGPMAGDLDELRRILDSLEAIPRGPEGRILSYDGKQLSFDLSYEITELHKDLLYLERGEAALLRRLAELHPGFAVELEAGRSFLGAIPSEPGAAALFRSLLTDRDGTVNNYCGRYYSSIQSVYNAVFLTRFARRRCGRSVILSSAPLEGGGLLDVSVVPPGAFVLAGSKGREALDEEGGRHRLPVPAAQQAALDRLNRELERLLERPEFEIFGLIGSGLQLKFGQSTVAHQDVRGSIPEELSRRFRESVQDLILTLDPERKTFRTEDTGKDLEILLTVDARAKEGAAGGDLRDFDKGDGIRFLDRELGLGLNQGPNLVCGDTSSDLPMVEAAVQAGGETWAIFVTRDAELRRRLRRTCPRSWCASEPDVLVALLNELGREAA
ncbi:MAG: hypothetical protein JW820_19350 [Spirochaetales bacterium]|nr:hypothetical protein [Spirochaetales bacterium]